MCETQKSIFKLFSLGGFNLELLDKDGRNLVNLTEGFQGQGQAEKTVREPSKDFYPDFEPPSPQFMSSILNRDWVSITLHFSQLSKMAAITKPYPDSFLALQVYFLMGQ